MKKMMNRVNRLGETAIGYAALGLIGAISLGAEIASQARWPRECADGQSV